MAQLLVRKVDERVVTALRTRAARHQRSVEAEHRHILEQALLGPDVDGFKALLLAMPDGGDEDLFVRSRDLPRDVKR